MTPPRAPFPRRLDLRALPWLAALLLACGHTRPERAPAPDTTATLPVPGLGAIELTLPPGWQARPTDERARGEDDDEAPASVELGPPGAPFVALLTPVGEGDDGPRGADAARLLAELARRKAAESAAEPELPLEALEVEGAPRGYWFTATDRDLEDRAPGEGEYRHVLQGVAAVGPLLLGFTLLDNGPGPHRDALLEVVRTARHRAEGTAGAGPGGPPAPGRLAGTLEPDPDARTVPYVARDPRGRVTVLVDLPGFRMFRPKPARDGRALVVVGEEPGAGLVVSLILLDASGDARACRDRDLKTLRDGTPGLTGVVKTEAGPQARLGYRVPTGGEVPVEQVHAHAFLARDGTCVNLHLSLAAPDGDAAGRVEEILGSLRFGERL